MAGAVLIANPFATSVTERKLAEVQAVLEPLGGLETLLTQQRGHATELAREACANGCDTIFVFSGDGTSNEVLNGVEAGAEVRLGFIPGGGTSVLPRALGLPRDALASARLLRESAVQDRTRRISLGRVNGRRFAFNAGIGFDAEAVRRFDGLGRRDGGKRPGDARFLLMIAEMLWDHRLRYEAAAELEGAGPVSFAIASNSDVLTYVGRRALRIAPQARFELGLDIVAPRAVGPGEVPRLAAYLFSGRERLRGDNVHYLHDVDRAELHCFKPLPLQADGEDLGDAEHVVFESERDAVTVLV
jgi:diacylglycerol kinase family enzyme